MNSGQGLAKSDTGLSLAVCGLTLMGLTRSNGHGSDSPVNPAPPCAVMSDALASHPARRRCWSVARALVMLTSGFPSLVSPACYGEGASRLLPPPAPRPSLRPPHADRFPPWPRRPTPPGPSPLPVALASMGRSDAPRLAQTR